VTGRANQENKYEFPPPIDNTLFFGNCVLVNGDPNEEAPGNLTAKEWNTIYDQLYGGFEDIGDSEEESEDEEDDDDVPRTATGYVKDGFVVDDDVEEESEEESEEEAEEEEEEIVVKKKPVKKAPTKAKKAPKNVFEAILSSANSGGGDVYLDCTSELAEEPY
jgi:hypothetical protein